MDGIEVIGYCFRRERLAPFDEAVIVEDGAHARVGQEPLSDAHVSRLQIGRERERAVLYGNPTQ